MPLWQTTALGIDFRLASFSSGFVSWEQLKYF